MMNWVKIFSKDAMQQLCGGDRLEKKGWIREIRVGGVDVWTREENLDLVVVNTPDGEPFACKRKDLVVQVLSHRMSREMDRASLTKLQIALGSIVTKHKWWNRMFRWVGKGLSFITRRSVAATFLLLPRAIDTVKSACFLVASLFKKKPRGPKAPLQLVEPNRVV